MQERYCQYCGRPAHSISFKEAWGCPYEDCRQYNRENNQEVSTSINNEKLEAE